MMVEISAKDFLGIISDLVGILDGLIIFLISDPQEGSSESCYYFPVSMFAVLFFKVFVWRLCWSRLAGNKLTYCQHLSVTPRQGQPSGESRHSLS